MTTDFEPLHSLHHPEPPLQRMLKGAWGPSGHSRFESGPSKTRILILGAGVAGACLAAELEHLSKPRELQVTLVGRDNFYLMTPLLFEAATGAVEARHVVTPIRPLLQTTRFVRGEVTQVDLARRVVSVESGSGKVLALPYDQLVVALGGVPAFDLVQGARNARPFKTLEDAIALRTHVIDVFERATLERDPELRKQLLRFVIVGGGLVGVELAGELWHFVLSLLKTYRAVCRHEVSLHILQAGQRLLPELEPSVAAYVERTYARRGIQVRTAVTVERIEPQELYLPQGERMSAGTIVYAAGLAMSRLVAGLQLEHDLRGRIVTDSAMRSLSRPEVWALGDNAAVPMPDRPGQTYPALLQFAHREAKALARNIERVLEGEAPAPFAGRSLGTAALLGSGRAVISVSGVLIRGFFAWCLWRSLFLLRVPTWERRLRLLADWTAALVFRADSAQLRLPLNEPVSSSRTP